MAAPVGSSTTTCEERLSSSKAPSSNRCCPAACGNMHKPVHSVSLRFPLPQGFKFSTKPFDLGFSLLAGSSLLLAGRFHLPAGCFHLRISIFQFPHRDQALPSCRVVQPQDPAVPLQVQAQYFA